MLCIVNNLFINEKLMFTNGSFKKKFGALLNCIFEPAPYAEII